MKLFISWSGSISRDVALALREWLPNVIQKISEEDIFLSSEDIEKGSPWFQRLGKVLEETDFGILCLTPHNLTAPWILYEAGAVAKRVGEARVTPLLIGLAVSDLTDPLAQFNATLPEKSDIKKLLTTINAQLGKEKISSKQLDVAFLACWPDLEPKLTSAKTAALQQNYVDYAYDVFLSAPMAAFAGDIEYKASRKEIVKIFNALKQECGFNVYWAAEKIESMEDFDTLDISVIDDLRALEQSRNFILFYPCPLPTSALFEAGYALALKRTSHYFVSKHEDLPFLMRELSGPAQNVFIHTDQDWKNHDDLVKKVKRYKAKWFK